MVKKKNELEETQIDDLDAFEEWEAGEEEAPAVDDTLEPKKKKGPEEHIEEEDLDLDLDLKDLEEPPAETPPMPLLEDEVVSEEEFSESLMDLAPDVPVNLVAVIGKANINVGELMKTRVGNVLDLGRPPGETVDLVANGRLIARGELVEMDGQLGVRILKMVK